MADASFALHAPTTDPTAVNDRSREILEEFAKLNPGNLR